MRTPLALLVLLFASAARAGVPTPVPVTEPTSKAVEEDSGYWHSSNSVSWWGDVVSRRSISLVDPFPSIRQICMIPPAADWVTEGAQPAVEAQYLLLLLRVNGAIEEARGSAWNVGSGSRCGVTAYPKEAKLMEYTITWSGSMAQSIKDKTRFNGCISAVSKVAGHPKYASQGKNMPPVGEMVADTVNLLLKSKTPETQSLALSVAQELVNGDRFVDTLEAMVKDKSLTAKITISPNNSPETLTVREYAMRALATTNPTERSAKLLALIWHDEQEEEAMRAAAVRSFAFVVSQAKLHKELFSFLNPLMGINMDENDKKDAGGSAAKLSQLGDAAFCAGSVWPKEKRDFAKQGLDWDGNSGSAKPKAKTKK